MQGAGGARRSAIAAMRWLVEAAWKSCALLLPVLLLVLVLLLLQSTGELLVP
jgi:hypothetical protein